ncbi:MAG: TIGR00153 family protein [Alphaproteobacteria bacterium]
MRTTNPLFRLFGQSPFKPLQEHMRLAVRCAEEVPGLFEAVCAGDQEKVEAIRDEIFSLENSADAVKNELRAHLPRSLFLPVDRGDLLEILDLQDSIADTAQDIAGMLVVRPMTLPESLRVPLLDLTHRCVDACKHMARIIEELDELMETGFRGRESEIVLDMIDELNKIETETDLKGTELLHELFAQEGVLDPVSLIIWLRLIHWIGDLANYAEKVGNRLRLLLARK